MPELPEVEITRRGLLKHLKGKACTGVVVRETRFRKAIPGNLDKFLVGHKLVDIDRRGKYLIWKFDNGVVLSHLGMSGVFAVVTKDPEGLRKHDHLDIEFGDLVARYHDPRRFGFVTWLGLTNPLEIPELQKLGIEPFSDEFDGDYLRKHFQGSGRSVKEMLLSGSVVVGVGNIYCSESLFLAGINPKTKAGRISKQRLDKLAQCIKKVLAASLEAGGSTISDFVSAEGERGHFTLQANVYQREGQKCTRCGALIKRIVQNGRSSFYCPKCQR